MAILKIKKPSKIEPVKVHDLIFKQPIESVLIIGNGFDKSLGLKTGYTDFIEDNTFSQLLHNNNRLAKYLSEKKKLYNWIDIELELATYSKKFRLGDETFNNDFYELSEQLKKFLNSIDIKTIDKKSIAYLLVKDIINFRTLVLDFNYTESTSYILKNLKFNSNEIEHIKVHGTLKNNNIIFGVDDKADIDTEHIFLKKSVHKNYSPINFSRYLAEAKSITIFGHSLGETDHMYFSDFFSRSISENNKMSDKDISIYYNGEKGRLNLHRQLDKLTHKSIAKFKQFNNVEFIETEE